MQMDADRLIKEFCEDLVRKLNESYEVPSKYAEVRTLKEAMDKYNNSEWSKQELRVWYHWMMYG